MKSIEYNSITGEITEREYTEEELLQVEMINSILQEIPYEQKIHIYYRFTGECSSTATDQSA